MILSDPFSFSFEIHLTAVAIIRAKTVKQL
jgi:hypothetical protein